MTDRRIRPRLHPLIRRLRPRRRLGWLWVAMTVATVLNGLRLRGRVQALRRVPSEPDPEPLAVDGDRSAARIDQVDPDHVFITAPGVRLDDAARRRASAFAVAHGLDVVDLVPGNLGIEQILDLVRLVDPDSYATNRLTTGRGPGQATLVHREVLRRAGLEDLVDDPDPVTYLEVTAQLKRYATKSIDLAVLDDLRAAPEDLRRRRGYLAALYSKAAPAAMAVPLTHDLLLAAGLVLAPGWSLAAALAYCLQPYVALRGTAVRPDDLTPTYAATRPLHELLRTARTLTGDAPQPGGASAPESDEARKLAYDDLLAEGIDRFFEPRRDRCPLCQGTALSVRLRSADLLQYKPGEFVLEGCEECGHVFQNPRLSLDGLDFYYRDFYDGLGEEQLDFVFSSDDASYLGRVDLVATHTQPKRWLDVGAGHGHFCLIASDVLPDARFDGLDLSDGIDEAERRQWVERGYRGLFTVLADELRGAYDVVSMHHYLEHTRDPADEIAAAGIVLESGGHLLIEVPDPECRWGRTLGWMWGPWFQPQHQHFVSVGNLAELLADHGFTVVEQQRMSPHQPVDLVFALLLATSRLAGPPPRPWRAAPSNAARLRRSAIFTVMAPFMVMALLVDRLIAPVISRVPGGSNTYRVLARRD
jgi:SAM-dependent methyltransferase